MSRPRVFTARTKTIFSSKQTRNAKFSFTDG